MSPKDKPLVFLAEIKSPPLSKEVRVEAGYLLRRLQQGEVLGMPHSKPLPSLGEGCHCLRIKDKDTWLRIPYRIDADAILILHIFQKKSNRILKKEFDICKKRIKHYNESSKA